MRGARPRGARDRRGDPRRLDREDPARPALARDRRRLRLDAGRQPARLARRRPRRVRGAPAGARARAAAARRRHAVGRTGRRERERRRQLPRRFASLVKIEHTVFALPFAYVGAFLAIDAVPSAHDLVWITVAMVGARSLAMALNRLIDAEIDARNPRTAGREIPAGKLSRAAGRRLLPGLARDLPRRRLAARPDLPVAVADPGDRVRRLPVPEAGHVGRAPVARCRRRARADGRLGGDPRRPALAGVGARRRRRDLGRRLRPLLLAVRRRGRPRPGAAFVGDPLGRARRVPRRARAASPDRVGARRRRGRARRRLALLDRRRGGRRRCSPTSTRSSGRATCAASTRPSSP